MAQGFKVQAYIDGTRLVELSNISFTANGGKTRIDTIEGLVAFTQATRTFELQCTWAWFTTGPEVDIITWCADRSQHDVQLPLGNGKSIISTGEFMECGGQQSSTGAAELTATFNGSFNKPR